MTFGEYLNECVDKREIPIAKITRISGINRGKLYNVFYNKRRLSEEELFALIEKAGFSPMESEKLIDLYYAELFGETEFSRIKFLEEALQKDWHRHEACECRSYESCFKNPIESENQLLGAIAYILTVETDVITNFPLNDKRLDDIVFSCLKSTKLKLTHILEFTEDQVGTENLKTLFAALKYMYNGSFPLYRYKHSSKDGQSLFPYFFVGKNHAVHFNGKTGIVLSDDAAIQTVRTSAAEIMEKCIPLGTSPDDNISQVMELYGAGFNEKKLFYTFSYYPCIAKYTDYDVMYNVANGELPEKEALAKMAYNHYSGVYGNLNTRCFVTTKGLNSFVQTGNIQEVPSFYVKNLSKDDRIKILKNMLNGIASGEIYILDDTKISLNPGIHIDATQNKLYFNGYSAQNSDFCIFDNYISTLTDSVFINTIENFASFLIRSKKVFTNEYSATYINNLIAKIRLLKEE